MSYLCNLLLFKPCVVTISDFPLVAEKLVLCLVFSVLGTCIVPGPANQRRKILWVSGSWYLSCLCTSAQGKGRGAMHSRVPASCFPFICHRCLRGPHWSHVVSSLTFLLGLGLPGAFSLVAAILPPPQAPVLRTWWEEKVNKVERGPLGQQEGAPASP